MITIMTPTMRDLFGERVQENASLAPYTSARIGGPADYLLEVRTGGQLAEVVERAWEAGLSFTMLGGGSNVLVSDRGVRGLVILNRAKAVQFESHIEWLESSSTPEQAPFVRAESGVVISNLAQRAAAIGLSGLEWAATVPGTVGGAVYGNAGAFGGDMAASLIRAEILTQAGREWWSVPELGYGYRTSALKRGRNGVVLAAEMRLADSDAAAAQARVKEFIAKRKGSQPPGASMGSMFKNPPGNFAGRLIEHAGLRGTRIGNAEISAVHGNFILNTGNTRAEDVKALIELARRTVHEKFGVELELEVELIGEWQ